MFRKNIARLLFTFIISFFVSLPVLANTPRSEEATTRTFIKLRNLGMNIRSANDVNGTPLGVIGKGSMIQLPDNFGVFDSRTGELDLGSTLSNWDNLVRDSRYSALAPKPCSGTSNGQTVETLCFPVRVHQSTNSNVPNNTIGYISLKYMHEHVDKNRYVSGRTVNETTARFDAAEAADPSGSGSEVTSPGAVTPGASDGAIWDCDDTAYSSRNYATNNCLHRKYKNTANPLLEKAKHIVRKLLEMNQRRPAFQMDPRLTLCMAYKESGFSTTAKGGTPDYGLYQVINSTGRSTIRATQPTIKEFQGISWEQYRSKMLKSTLAQTDLHHNVVYQKAKHARLVGTFSSVMKGTAAKLSTTSVKKLAGAYNGSGPSGGYAAKISSCYTCMAGISTKTGVFNQPSGLKGCLNRAK